MVFKLIVSIGFLASSVPSVAADFNGHREFTHVDLVGDVDVTCLGGGQIGRRSFQCSGYMLNPQMFSRFHHEFDGQADRVTLSTQHRNNKTVRKSSDWDQSKQRSKDAFNLWVSTVFQRPLLQMGLNTISYDLTRSGRSVESGTFMVRVNDGGTRQCRYRRITTTDSTLCENGNIACGDYFELENNCEYE